MLLATILAIMGVALSMGAQYRFLMLGSPASVRWRVRLVLVGMVLGSTLPYFLFTLIGALDSPDPTERRAALLAIAGTTFIGAVASGWLIPRGLRVSMEQVERNRNKKRLM